MATIANLDVNLRAKTQKYETNMKRAGQSTRRFSETTQKAAMGTESFQAKLASFAKKGLAVTAVITGLAFGINKLVGSFADTGDALAKSAGSAQISTKDFQSLAFAFEKSGSSADGVSSAFEAVGDRFVDLQDGSTTMIALFKRMGLSLADLSGLDTADRFRLIAKSINNIKDPLERVGVASKIFGGTGKDILNVAGNLGTLENEFNNLGLSIDEGALQRASALKDANLALQKSWEKLTSVLGSKFIPVIVDLTEKFAGFLVKVSNSIDKLDIFIQKSLGLKSIPQFAGAVGGVSDDEFQRFLSQRGGGSRIVRKRLKVNDPLSDSGSSFLIDRQINAQKELIQALKQQSNKLAPLPQALQKGTSAQIGFVAQLQRQNQQAKIDAREKKKIDLAEKHLKELEKIRKQREDEFKDKTEISIL